MQTANATGRTTGTTDEEPSGDNSGDCVFCGRPADGIDADTRLPVCRDCGVDLDSTAGRRFTDGGVDKYTQCVVCGFTFNRDENDGCPNCEHETLDGFAESGGDA